MPESSGGSLYVSLSGRDSATGSIARPFRTVGRAVSAATSGTTIFVRGGRYRERWQVVAASFSAANPVTIENYPGESVAVVGDGVIFDNGLLLRNDRGIRIHGGVGGGAFTIQYRGGVGLKIDNSQNIEIDRLFVAHNGVEGILVIGDCCYGPRTYSSDVQIWNSTFTDNGGAYPAGPNGETTGSWDPDRHDHSIYYGASGGYGNGVRNGTEGGVVANNVIYDQDYGFAMRIGDAARGLLVVNNTIYNAHVHCIWCDPYWGDAIMLSNASGSDNYYTQHVGVYNNVIVDSAAAVYGGVVISSPTNTVDYNLSWKISSTHLDCAPDCNFNPRYGLYELYTAGAHNMKGVNPLFVDPRRHDYHLRAGSPARGKANPGYTPPRDADGNRRPAAPALGAFR